MTNEFKFTDDDDSGIVLSDKPVKTNVKNQDAGTSSLDVKVPVSWVLVLLLSLFSAYLYFNGVPTPGPSPRPDDQEQEQVASLEDLLSQGYVYFVHEGTAPTEPELTLIAGSDAWVAKHDMRGKRIYDVDQPDASRLVAAAKEANITGSFIGIVNDRAVQRVVKWPASFQKLEEALK